MINLKEYIKEGFFDDLDKIEKIGGMESNIELLKKEVIDWIKNNVKSIQENKFKFDVNTSPITVNYDDDIKFREHITSLTNGNFQWGEVSGCFGCAFCAGLKSLEGAPKKVGGYFYCAYCDLKTLKGAPEEVGGSFQCNGCESLESLEGAPKETKNFNCNTCSSLKTLKGAPKVVSESFDCSYCESLESLEGGPEKVSGHFNCRNCDSLKSLKGAPKKVGSIFNCSNCYELTSLKGAPKEVGGGFNCFNCGTRFSENDVKKVSKVREGIIC